MGQKLDDLAESIAGFKFFLVRENKGLYSEYSIRESFVNSSGNPIDLSDEGYFNFGGSSDMTDEDVKQMIITDLEAAIRDIKSGKVIDKNTLLPPK